MQVATDLNEWPASYSLWKYDFRGRIWISFSENFRTGHLICCCWQINQTITSTPHTIFCCSLGARLISTRLLEKFFRGVVIRSIPILVTVRDSLPSSTLHDTTALYTTSSTACQSKEYWTICVCEYGGLSTRQSLGSGEEHRQNVKLEIAILYQLKSRSCKKGKFGYVN